MANTEMLENDVEQGHEALRSGARQMKEKFEKTRDSLQEQSQETWEDLVEAIKKNPARALGITLAAGVVVGLSAAALTRRRHSALENVMEGLKCAINDAVAKFK